MIPGKSYLSIAGLACCIVVFSSCKKRPAKAKDPVLKARQDRLKKDTGRIKGYINLAYDHLSHSPDSAEYYYRLAYDESKALGYHDGIVVSVLGITNRWFETGNYDSCDYYYDIAERNADTPDFDGRLYAMVMLNKGSYYDLKGDIVNADRAFFSALEKSKEPGRVGKTMKMYLLYNLGGTKLKLKQQKEALYYITEAEKVLATSKDSSFKSYLQFARAKVYLEMDMIDSAHYIISNQIQAIDSFDYDHLRVIATLYFKKGEPQTATPFINKGIENAKNANNYFEEESMRILLGRAYNLMKNYPEARVVLRQSLTNCLTHNLHRNYPDVYEALIETEKKLGNFDDAFQLLERSSKYNDSVLNEKKTAELNEMNVRYKSEQKDRELSQNQLLLESQDNKLKRQRLYGVGATLTAVLLTLVVLALRKASKRKSKIKEQEVQMLRQENEIVALQSRMEGEEKERQRLSMELHDGIGSQLSTVLMQLEVLKDQSPGLEDSKLYKDIEGLVTTTATEVRNTASNLMPDAILNLGLTDALTEYVHALNIGEGPEIKLQAFGAIDSLPLQLRLFVYRVVQELIHNIVKHSRARKALVQVSEIEGLVSITVEDDGKGFDSASTGSGKGLKNIQNRVEKLGGIFSFRSEPGKGTTAYIEFDKKVFSYE